VIAVVAVRAVDQLDRLATVERQPQAIAISRDQVGVILEALRFLRPLGGGVVPPATEMLSRLTFPESPAP